ncbi:MAG: hypothetical protein JSW35_01755 [Deltaproteobacteria bacterium]|nr:MAG: hypothetical protein JSW35_01755 [Deltaproteobacteria bacterium]
MSPDHVRFGGIIIGRDDALVECKEKDYPVARQLADQALHIRDSVFYRPSSIKLWTWDRILAIAESQTISHQRIAGDPSTSVDLKLPSAPIGAILAKESLDVKVE